MMASCVAKTAKASMAVSIARRLGDISVSGHALQNTTAAVLRKRQERLCHLKGRVNRDELGDLLRSASCERVRLAW